MELAGFRDELRTLRLPGLGHAPAYVADPLGFVGALARQQGPVAKAAMGDLSFYLLTDAELVRRTFVSGTRSLSKGPLGRDRRRLFGQGLATSDGQLWRRQRRLIQPAFSAQRLEGYAAEMSQVVERELEGWPVGRRVDLHELVMQLTLKVVGRVLFGTDVAGQVQQVGRGLDEALAFFTGQTNLLYRLLPRGLSSPGRRRFRTAVDSLDEVVRELIDEKREHPGERDLLSALIAARDGEAGVMSDSQLRDEVMTLLLAGHETTALALSWTLSLLARHPAAEARVVAELASVLGNRSPSWADLRGGALPFTTAVLQESMRLYPPAWILVRQTEAELELAGRRIEKGAFVVASQWVLHRDERYFEHAQSFLPERWLEGPEKRVEQLAYFPFGAGQRVCIGSQFAMLEATIVLARLLARYRFSCPRVPRPVPSLSLRPRGGVQGELTPRSAPAPQTHRQSLSASLVIDAPPAQVWSILSNFHEVDRWAKPVDRVLNTGIASRGLGARRRCEVRGIGNIDEVIVAWEPERLLAYDVAPFGPVRGARSTWRIEPSTSCRVRLQLDFTPTMPGVHSLLRPLLQSRLDRTLVALKRHVEMRPAEPAQHNRAIPL